MFYSHSWSGFCGSVVSLHQLGRAQSCDLSWLGDGGGTSSSNRPEKAVVNCSDTHGSVMLGLSYSLAWVATSHHFYVASCCAVDPVKNQQCRPGCW